MTEKEQLQLNEIQKTLTATRVEVAGLRADLRGAMKSLDTITRQLGNGDGLSSRVVKLEAESAAAHESVDKCQKRCTWRLRWTLGAVAGLLTPLVIWGAIKVIGHFAK